MTRCHARALGPTEFNPKVGTPGRFRPVRSRGRVVATLYAAGDPAGAISETVFQRVPIIGAPRRVRVARFEHLLLATIAPRRELSLVRLHGHGFHRLGVTRARLIESRADSYGQLAKWGQALHDCPAEPDGLLWRSRHYDDAYACLLFGDRVPRRDLEPVGSSLPLGLGRGLELVAQLADDADITLVA